jgi:dTDP-4-dehydrorhamnose reductase
LTARGLSRAEVDLLEAGAVRELYGRERPEVIIHCAAQSSNVICEQDPEAARRANVEMTRDLLKLAADIPFIFFSTDLIFDGEKGDYAEEDAANPLSVYGRTKAEAEELVRKHPRSTIVRISLTGGHSRKGNRGFNEEMKNAWRAGKTLQLFTDEYRCPSSADVVARAVWEMVGKGATGTFHLCGAEKLSRFEIGELLAAKHPELTPRIVASSRRDYHGAPRPRDTSMNCAKLQSLLSFPIPRFSEWLEQDQSGF